MTVVSLSFWKFRCDVGRFDNGRPIKEKTDEIILKAEQIDM